MTSKGDGAFATPASVGSSPEASHLDKAPPRRKRDTHRLWLPPDAPPCTITAFGFSFGIPPDVNWVMDMRFIANPYWVEELRGLSGREPAVRDYIVSQPAAQQFLDLATELLVLAWTSQRFPLKQINLGLGCTGGRHRSVVMAEALSERLIEVGANVTVVLRDVDRPDPRWH